MIAIYYLPLAVSQSLLSCAVFATMILGYFVLDEKLSAREILTIIGGVAGILILVNPEWFGHETVNVGKAHKKRTNSTSGYTIGLFFALLFSIFSSMKLISIRAIGENIHTSVKNYYFGVIGSVVTVVANMYL